MPREICSTCRAPLAAKPKLYALATFVAPQPTPEDPNDDGMRISLYCLDCGSGVEGAVLVDRKALGAVQ